MHSLTKSLNNYSIHHHRSVVAGVQGGWQAALVDAKPNPRVVDEIIYTLLESIPNEIVLSSCSQVRYNTMELHAEYLPSYQLRR